MKSSTGFRIMVVFSIIIWILIGINACLGNSNDVYILGHHINPEGLIGKFFLGILTIIIIGISHFILGLMGKIILFPLYYLYKKISSSKEIFNRIKWPKIRIIIALILWISFATIFSLTEKDIFGILCNNKILLFLFAILYVIFIGFVFRLCGYFGDFILSPIYLIYRNFFPKKIY